MTGQGEIHPPAWPLKIARLFVKSEFLEEIEGDMEEVFRDNVNHQSLKRAKRIYTWEVVKLLRPTLIDKQQFQFLTKDTMLKNYFKVSLRGLVKNPMNSFI